MTTLIEQLQQIQKDLQDVTISLAETLSSISDQPQKAYNGLLKLKEHVNGISVNWEQWLRDYGTFDAANAQICRNQQEQILLDVRISIEEGLGTSLTLLDRFLEAETIYKHALAMLGDRYKNHPEHASLLESLGRLALQQNKFDAAEEYYQQAYQRYHNASLLSDNAKLNEISMGEESDITADEKSDYDNVRTIDLQNAARVLSEIAEVALHRGDRELFLKRQKKAIEFAETHEFAGLAENFRLYLDKWNLQWDVRGDVPGELKSKLRQRRKEFEPDDENISRKVDVLLLEAENSQSFNSSVATKGALDKAQKLLEQHPELSYQWYRLHLAYAGYRESQGNVSEAFENASEALRFAKQLEMPDLIQQAVESLCFIANLKEATSDQKNRAQQILNETIDKLRMLQAGDACVDLLLMRAQENLKDERYDSALTDLNEAFQIPVATDLQSLILSAKAAVLKKSGDTENALAMIEQAIALHLKSSENDEQSSDRGYRDRLYRTETLHESAAFLAAELGHSQDTFNWLEQGKNRILRQQLAQISSKTPGDDQLQFPETGYDQKLIEILRSESASFLFFCVGAGRTLALLLDPLKPAPQTFFVDLSESDLQEAQLAERLWPATDTNKNEFIPFLSGLSEKLFTKLRDILEEVMQRCEVLYIIPDSRLYLVPFSALTLNGTTLFEHSTCALALVPSVSFWLWCRARRLKESGRSCLAIGVGRENEVSFADQVRAIMAGCNWTKPPTFLLDDTTPVTKSKIWEQAKNHSILHFSCHGMEEPTTLDTLDALHLNLSDNEKLYAQDVFDHKDKLSAELVFLNACMSGRFKLRHGLAIGGFWEAFLHAGATSIIATLASVHPQDAQELAHAFYRIWLQGNITKAHALQQAQQELHQHKPESFHWARYILIGDHR